MTNLPRGILAIVFFSLFFIQVHVFADCPEGFYCPKGSRYPVECPAGSYCVQNSTLPSTCTYESLLRRDMYMDMPRPSVLERLIVYLDPYTGNFCPTKSSTPNTRCASGYFCPNTTISLPCPRGFVCKLQTVVPHKCPALTVCPSGQAHPSFNGMAFFVAMLIVLACFAVNMAFAFSTSHHTRKQVVKSAPQSLSCIFVANMDIDNALPEDVERLDCIPNETLDRKAYASLEQSIPGPIKEVMRLKSLITPLKSLRFTNLSVTDIHTGCLWLAPNSGTFAPCRFNAIMGSSGCGKSLTLGLLVGRIPKANVTGCIEVNGHRVSTWDMLAKSTLHKIRAIVPQDDILYAQLTVRESLMYSAMTKLPINQNEQRNIVNATLQMLGLSLVADQVIGSVEQRGISGGQRKRVNIGIEVVGLPSLLFMDEPTSGLDSTASQDLLQFCRSLTDCGMTIVAVVHQPRYTSFALFDSLLLLGRHGTVFCGSPAMALLYFQEALLHNLHSDENPADELIDIIASTDQKELADQWTAKGRAWVSSCSRTYPYLPYMLDQPITYEPGLGLDVAAKSLLINASIDRKYTTSVSRIVLFSLAPPSIAKKLVTIRSMAVAYEFGMRLLRKVRCKACTALTERSNDNLRQACLACMLAKAKALVHKRNIVRSHESMCCIVQAAHPRWVSELWVNCSRKVRTTLRTSWATQIMVLLVASFIVAWIHGAEWRLESYPNNIASSIVVLAVVSVVTHIKTFGNDKVVMCREIDNGASVVAFFVSYNCVDLIWIVTFPVVFLLPYHLITFPWLSFYWYYITGLLVCWWISGTAYVVSALPIEGQWSTLIAVFMTVIIGAFLQGLNPTLTDTGNWLFFSYNRWAMEAMTIKEYLGHKDQQPNILYAVFDKYGICGTNNDRMLMPIAELEDKCATRASNALLAMMVGGFMWRSMALVMFVAQLNPLTSGLLQSSHACLCRALRKKRSCV